MDMNKLLDAAELFQDLVAEATLDEPLIKIAPNWATDEKTWERAKKVVQKSYKGKKKKKDLWPIITDVYKNMGGKIKKKKKKD